MTPFTGKILDILKDQSKNTLELIEMMLCSRPESYRRFRKSMMGHSKQEGAPFSVREKQNFYNLLNYLKREGLVSKEEKNTKTFWIITGAGLKRLEDINRRVQNSNKSPGYLKEKTNKSIIVAFDIPERLGRHRAWLREVLRYLDFNMAQKSLWIGTCKIPEGFIVDLKRKGIIEHVDIFELGSKGTLKRMALE